MLASAVFFYGRGSTGTESPASLFDGYDLIRDSVGQCELGQVVFEME
jgi:metal iron transporter